MVLRHGEGAEVLGDVGGGGQPLNGVGLEPFYFLIDRSHSEFEKVDPGLLFGLEAFGDVEDVVAFVAVFGHGVAMDEGFHRLGEEAHLFGVHAIVDVVLAVDFVTGGFEDVAEGGAEGGSSSGADGDGAVGVDGDKFDVYLKRTLGLVGGVAMRLRRVTCFAVARFAVMVDWLVEVGVVVDFLDEAGDPGGVEAEVDESGAGDFYFLEEVLIFAEGGGEGLGGGAGVLFGGFGGDEGEVGGEIAVGGVFGDVDFYGKGGYFGGKCPLVDKFADSIFNGLFEVVADQD